MNKNIKLIFNYLLAPALFIILSWSLYQQLTAQPDLHEKWQYIKESWRHPLIPVILVLMLFNWGLEARKWQLLISTVQKFSFLTSFKSVLAGCSVTMLTPNRIGEFGGRIIYVEEQHRLKAISLTVLGSISQLLVTMLWGITGLLVMRYMPLEDAENNVIATVLSDLLLYVAIFITVILMLIYMRIKWLVALLAHIKILRKFVTHIKILDVFSRKQLLRILFLSFSRYIVFILQYVLLLNVMGVQVSMVMCFWLLTIFYLVMAVAPTIGILELPVRAAASVELLSLYSTNIPGIQAAALGIWIINLVLPAIAGSMLIFGIKILKER